MRNYYITILAIVSLLSQPELTHANTCYSAYTPSPTASQQNTCSGNTVTLYANGNLRDNSYWAWYKDGCASTSVGTGWSINVAPTTTTTYYVRGEGGCAPGPGPCGQITINVTPGINAPVSNDVYQCQPDSVVLSATPTGINQTVDWFNVPSGGSPLTGGYGTTNFTTPYLTTFTTFYTRARDTLTGCYSANRTAVTVYIGSGVNNTWISKASFPGTGRYGGVSFEINGKAYTGTGINSNNSNTDEFWEYDLHTDTWAQKANFGGGPRHHGVGFSIGNKGYLGTGENGPTLSDFWEYNPTTNIWIQKANVPGNSRVSGVGFASTSKGYIGLGNNGNYGGVQQWYNDFWEYNPQSDSWMKMNNFPGTTLGSPVCGVINDKAYICTGYNGSAYTNGLWEYNITLNSWTEKSPLPSNARGAAFGFSLGSKFYLGGGTPDGGVTSYTDFWEYNPSVSSWTQKPDVGGTPRCYTNYFSGNGKGYVLSGISSGGVSYNELWEYSPVQMIQTLDPLVNNYCPGAALQVPYKISGNFGTCSSNTFTVQLSDASGYFNAPVNIGSITANTDSIIPCIIPTGIASGTAYRIRVVSSSPAVNGADNGTDINIGTSVNSWNQKATFPSTGRIAPSGFGIGNYGYTGLGYDGSSFKNDWWQYDPATNTWTQKSDFGGAPRGYAASFVINGKGYVGTGLLSFSGTDAVDFWEYDPISNQWNQRANFPGIARDDATGFTIGAKGYVFGGVNSPSSVPYNDLYEYDPASNTWITKVSLPAVARGGAIGFGINGLGYVGLGADGSSNYPNDFWAYNPQTNTWAAKAGFPGPSRREASSLSIGQFGYVSCGLNGSTLYKDLWQYNPVSNAWSQKAALPAQARKLAACFNVQNTIYLGLGATSTSLLNDMWAYNAQPEIKTLPLASIQYCAGDTFTIGFTAEGTFGQCSTNTFIAQLSDAYGYFSNPVQIGSINGTTGGTIACSLPAGINPGLKYRVRVISTDLPVTGSDNGADIAIGVAPSFWTQKAYVGTVGRQAAVAFSIGGKGYVGTGYNNSSSAYLKDFWEYDEATNTWTQKADFGGTARYYAIALELGGKGYVGAGYDAASTVKNDFWQYDPITNTWLQKANIGGNPRWDAFGFAVDGKGYAGCGTDGSTWLQDFWEYNPVSDTWTQKGNFQGGYRMGACTFIAGSNAYVATGQAPYGVYKDDLWQYNPASDTWTKKNSFDGGGRYRSVGIGIGNNGYIFSPDYKQLWKYESASDAWIQLPDFPASTRNHSIGFAIGTKGYVGAGTYSNDIYSFNPDLLVSVSSITPTGVLCPGANISVSYTASGVFGTCTGNTFYAELSDEYGYFYYIPQYIGSVSSNASGTIACTLPSGLIAGANYKIRIISSNPLVYSTPKLNIAIGTPAKNIWTEKSAFSGSAGRSSAASFSIGNKGYIGTGTDGTSFYRDLWEYDPATDVWTQKAILPGVFRSGAVGFSVNNKGYIGTGYSNTGTYLNDMWEYDPVSNTWLQKANFGGAARIWAVAFTIGSKAYVGTGADASSARQDFWEFDPQANSWIQKADFAGGIRYGAAGFSIEGRGYLGTGHDGSSAKSDFWEFNPTLNIWTQKTSYGSSYYGTTGFSIGQRGYIGLGRSTSNYFTNYFQEYNPLTNSWTSFPFKGTGRSFASSFIIGNTAFTGCGYDGTNVNDFYELKGAPVITTSAVSIAPLCAGGQINVPYIAYGDFGSCNSNTFTAQLSDASGSFASPVNIGSLVSNTSGSISATIPANTPNGTGYRIRVVSSNPVVTGSDNGGNLYVGMMASNVWTQKSNFGGISRQGSVSFNIGNKGYVGTGTDAWNNNYYNDFWEFDPSTNTWTQKANFSGNARYSAVGFAIGTKGYIGTGQDATMEYNDFWEYDQAANVWIQKSNFGGIPRGAAVGFAIGTKGYIGTGGSYLQDFWEWDQVTDTWVQKANFGGGVRNNAVGFSIDTKGYIGTGYTGGGFAQDFWEYDPYYNNWIQKSNFGGTSRAYANGFCIGNKGYMGMGSNPGILTDFYEWNPKTNVWTLLASFSGYNADIGFAIGQKGYVGIGITNSGSDFWEYTPDFTISTGPLNTQPLCAGASITVPFSANGTFVCSNTFTAQLSDASGSFAAPVNIGSLVSNTSGTISATIPSNTPNGTGYRIRVVSSNPVVNGSDNGSNISIGTVSTNSWSQKSNFGGSARTGAFSFSIGTKGYMGTGNEISVGDKKDFWEYDQVTDTWTQKADFGGIARRNARGFSIGAKGYAGTGGADTQSGSILLYDFWEYDPALNVWTQKANYGGGAVADAVAFSIAGLGYMGTGYDGIGGGYRNDFWEYNPLTNTWTSKANFGGTARYTAEGLSIGNKGYIGLGFDSNNRKDFWEYDPTTNTWLQKADFGGSPRYRTGSFTIGNEGYIGGGFDNVSVLFSDFWKYNPASNQWTQVASFSGSTRQAVICFSLGNKGYIGTGGNANYTLRFNDLWEYTPAFSISTGPLSLSPLCAGASIAVPFTSNGTFICSNTFTAQLSDASGSFASPVNIGSLVSNTSGTISATIPSNTPNGTGYRIRVVSTNPVVTGSDNGSNLNIGGGNPGNGNVWTGMANYPSSQRQNAFSFTINGKGYVGTGYCCGSPLNDLWEYDALADAWVQKANFPGSARTAAVGFSINGKGYAGTGGYGSYNNDFYEYDPVNNTWVQKASFPGGARGGAVGFSLNNKGYIGTGENASSTIFYSDLWEYDPVMNTWIQKASFGVHPRAFAFSFTIGNRAYVGGGEASGNSWDDFWEYDPLADSWIQKAAFGGGVRYGVTGFSLGSFGYACCGYNSNSHNDCWMYNPASNQWIQRPSLPGSVRTYATGFTIEYNAYIGAGANGAWPGDYFRYTPDLLVSSPLTNNSLCQNSMFDVSYTSPGVEFLPCNTFTAQLSDANGSFASPVNIGSLVSPDSSGIIPVIVPNGTPPGNSYRIRVISNHPAITGTDNGSNISIGADTALVYYRDFDNDGFGDPNNNKSACTSPSGYVTNNTDCNDNSAFIHPGTIDICGNNIDEDCSGTDSICSSNIVLLVRLFIEGYYIGNSLMSPVLFNNGLSINTNACDSVIIELRESLSPFGTFISTGTILQTNGYANILLPATMIGSTYYIVVKQRNSIETWSKYPVTLTGGTNIFTFN